MLKTNDGYCYGIAHRSWGCVATHIDVSEATWIMVEPSVEQAPADDSLRRFSPPHRLRSLVVERWWCEMC
jgi:hypothetical protein